MPELHHPRPPLEMDGGTVFHFVTDGIHAALERARDAAGERASARWHRPPGARLALVTIH